MSNNISATNIAISGTCAFSGTVSQAQPVISGSTANYQGITTTSLKTTGSVIFDTLPKCNLVPSIASEITTKGYVDTQNNAQSTLIRNLEIRATAIESVNVGQDDRLILVEEANLIQDGRLDGIDIVNINQDGRLDGIDIVNINQDARLDNIEIVSLNQDTRLNAIDVININQDGRLVAQAGRIGNLEVKTTNLSFANNVTTIAGVSTAVGVMTFTVPPVSVTLPTVGTQVSNKQYVDTNITTTNNAVSALTSRVNTAEGKITNITYAGGNNTTSISGLTSFLNAPTVAATSTLANSLQSKSYIDARDLIATNAITALTTRTTAIEGVNTTQGTSIVNTNNAVTALTTRTTAIEGVNTTQGTSIVNTNNAVTALTTRTTAIEGVNTTQGSSISVLQQKTTPIVYVTPQPTAGPMTTLASSLEMTPYVPATVLKCYNISCQAITCLVQATFGGTGVNQGITTSQLQVGGFGIPFKTIYHGSITSTAGNNIVTFITPLTGTFPKVFLQGLNGTINLTSKTLAGFTFTTNPAIINVDYWVVQPL